MNTATTLLLIRHAHVDTGPGAGRLCGWLDLPLSTKGRQQLDTLRARGPADAPPAALYCSPLQRARETAVLLGGLWRIPVEPDDDLKEIHCGLLEGQPIEEIARRHADLWQRNVAQQDDDFTWPGGESYRAFRVRVLDAVHRLAARHPGQRIAIVTHSGVITQVLNTIGRRPAAAWQLNRPAPLTVVTVQWNGVPLLAGGFRALCR